MSSLLAAEYRLHAVECLELAERVSDIEDKARLVEIAQKFFELANKLEQRELAPNARDVRFGLIHRLFVMRARSHPQSTLRSNLLNQCRIIRRRS